MYRDSQLVTAVAKASINCGLLF